MIVTNAPVQITFKCRQCLNEIVFDLVEISKHYISFPLTLEDIHGTPPHKLRIVVDDNFEMASFETIAIEEE